MLNLISPSRDLVTEKLDLIEASLIVRYPFNLKMQQSQSQDNSLLDQWRTSNAALCRPFGLSLCHFGIRCRYKHGSDDDYKGKCLSNSFLLPLYQFNSIAALCPWEERDNPCRFNGKTCKYNHRMRGLST